MPAPSRIFVRLPNWLGDLLMARPMLHALRGRLPAARMVAVAPTALLELLAADGAVDEWLGWDRAPESRRRVVRELRAFKPELALLLPPSFSSAWLGWQSQAPVRVGYAHEGRSPLLSRALPRRDRGEQHLADEYVALAREACDATDVMSGLAPPLRLDDAIRAAGRRVAANAQLDPQGFGVLAPGASYGPAKRWPPERFVEIGRRIAAMGLRVVTCGTREEAAICEEVACDIGEAALSLAGNTTLPELAGLCAEARLAVCNDSGLAHLCAALGVRTVAVFGSTSSAWTAPRGNAVRIVQRAPVCSPCFRRECAIGLPCLLGVASSRVWDACEDLLREAT